MILDFINFQLTLFIIKLYFSYNLKTFSLLLLLYYFKQIYLIYIDCKCKYSNNFLNHYILYENMRCIISNDNKKEKIINNFKFLKNL